MCFIFVFFYLQSTLHLDINECTGSKKVCTDNATCTNTVGSFHCTCNPGFTDTLGDGSQCGGKKPKTLLDIFVSKYLRYQRMYSRHR